jgi:hypothetical protein
VAVPARKRATLEVIEAEFVLEFLILLLVRASLMRRWTNAGSDAVGGSATK